MLLLSAGGAAVITAIKAVPEASLLALTALALAADTCWKKRDVVPSTGDRATECATLPWIVQSVVQTVSHVRSPSSR